jgi:uncharacterized membrane-anchored protein
MTDAVAIDRSRMLNKVPEVTIFFWIIKILCTTVGETASDFLNVNLNFGLTGTSVAAGILLAVALIVQFRTRRYVPIVYWLNVVLISIFGTLVTDNLTDALGFPLEYSTAIFSALLLVTFAVWYRQEQTLSIHSIFTFRREAFYWLAVLFTFALGTAAGDLMAEALGLGYGTTGMIIVAIVAIFAVAWQFGLDSILAFWVIYIMTRPLGASLGDYLTQSQAHGGLGLGATVTTVLFTIGIVATVLYLAVSKADVTQATVAEDRPESRSRSSVVAQVAAVAALLLVASTGGYLWRVDQLRQMASAAGPADQSAPLGDLSSFHGMTQAMLESVNAGDWAKANGHANDIEFAWDSAEARLRPMNAEAWTTVDDAIDKALREVRAVAPSQESARVALQELLDKTANP